MNGGDGGSGGGSGRYPGTTPGGCGNTPAVIHSRN